MSKAGVWAGFARPNLWVKSWQQGQVKAVEESFQVRSMRNSSQLLKVLVLGLVILVVCAAFTYYFRYPTGWDFRNNLYLPIKLLLQQQSPYNIHVLVDNSNAIWLPMALGVFLPLGFLDLQKASNLWLLLNFCALLALIFIAAERKKPSLLKLIAAALFVLLFPSSIAHLNLGQISILICFVLTLIAWFYENLPDWAVGFLLAFALTKPQLVILFIPAFLYKIRRERGWKALGKLGFWTVAGSVLLSLPVMLIVPGWYQDFLLNLANNPSWAHPSIYVLVFSSLGGFGRVVGVIYFSIGLGLAIYLASSSDNKESLLWTLALTPVITPYIWSWDFVFLYPLMIYSVLKQKDGLNTALIISSYFLILVGFIAQKLSGQVDEILSWWVPWSLIIVSLIASVTPVRRSIVEN